MASRLRAKDPKAAEPSKPKVLIYGKSGVGKTWQALDFPGVYYIDSEGGADLSHYTDKLQKAGGVYMGPSDGACEFSVVIEQFKALATEQHDYRTVVVDSISKIFNSAVALEAERLGDKNGFGADKKPAIAAMRQLVAWIDRIDMNVILIAHESAEWGQNDKGERVEIGATFDCWPKLEYELHLALRIIKQGKARKAFVRKTRLLGFPEGEIFPWDYATFADRYGRDVIEGSVKQISLATPEQLAEVARLLESVKVEPDFVEKCFGRFKASAWSEVDTEQIAKTITYLRGKVAA
jgi:hypothetical protein